MEQNEEALKKCAQDYLARVKQEEQQYQALKIHAEEKLDRQELVNVHCTCLLLQVEADSLSTENKGVPFTICILACVCVCVCDFIPLVRV